MRAMRWVMGLWLASGVAAAAPNATARGDSDFLAFPMVYQVSAAGTPAVAWLLHQADRTRIRLVAAPDFKPIDLADQSDHDGQPITDIAISPDGRRVAFVTGSPAGTNPASLLVPPQATIWSVEARAGAAPVKLGAGSSPEFTPDGRLVFRRGPDLWSAPADAAAPAALLVPNGATLAQRIWTRDGKSFFFIQDRGGWSMLGRHDLGSDRVNWLVTGAERLGTPALSPDGKTIAYFRWPALEHGVGHDQFANEDFTLETVDVATGAIKPLWRSANHAGVRIPDYDGPGSLRWADDRTIVFRAEPDGWARLYAIARSGGQPRAITPAGCEVAESEQVEPDRLFVVHNCRNLDARQISTVQVSTGREQPIDSADAVIGDAAAIGGGAAGSRLVAFAGAGPDQPAMLRILDLSSRKLIFADRAAAYGYGHRFTAPAPQVVRFKAPDGATTIGQLFLPATKGPHPALVYVHGGPDRQMFPSFHTMNYYAYDYAMNRRFAELGYVVLSLNYRYGIGYGRAFREPAGRGWRGASEYQDVLGAGRWLQARSDVDARRIGIWGGSYGGLQTAQALARNSDIFAAGVAIHGVFDWSWPSAIPGHLNPSRFFGVGEADRATAFQSSPVAFVDGWRSPVLLVSGDQDMNVDVRETVDLTRKLKDRGVEVKTVIVPGEAHTMIRHQSWQQLWAEQSAFFDAHLGKP